MGMSEIKQSKTVNFLGLRLIRIGNNILYLKFLKPITFT
ncbi:hypothetical protein BG20_I0691 [Candidatus Nitrosarchaeum limnium BG20]|uniref:Uncharacterized protein n=1 Tax=Candidatus Nitrosarchaeum limnium BG20 TaxID=859192 RepID=S2E978_9ARCH|nr:hypothetical protein BG20_I0691 [Candidatus Nitrosarchaeum limnium BG20]